MTREPGDVIIKILLVDCRDPKELWICEQERTLQNRGHIGWLAYGAMVKLLLTVITFGCKVPSGIIIPALDAGAFFGRLVGQFNQSISPGVFAMVGAAAFLAGVSRMTVSLAVIMFELTGEVDYIPAFMVAILVAKWTADSLSSESVYDLAQTVLGHPFLDPEQALDIVKTEGALAKELIPPERTMREITLDIEPHRTVSRQVLETKLDQLKARGLMDAGIVLVTPSNHIYGYLSESELEFAITTPGVFSEGDDENGESVDLISGPLGQFVDRTPLTLSVEAPMEYVVEMFGKLGLKHLILVGGEGTLAGVVIKKRLVLYLEGLAKE
jgi:chloride channel 3/4/5